VYSLGVHQGALRRALLRYKYHGEWWWSAEFARLIAAYLDANASWFEDFDVLAAVPTYSGPGARRKWDPVRRILEELMALVGGAWEIDPDLVLKVAETPPMQGLDWASRQTLAAGELRDALVVPRRDAVSGATVLVLDDVMTEGSTLREVARALRSAGAAEVAGLVVARPPWSEPGEASGRGAPS
jgi:predicted amidophosphoribosyltransferase